MTETDSVLHTFRVEVQEIEKRYRKCFEAVLGVGYDESADALDSMALDLIKMHTSPATFVPDEVDDDVKRTIDDLNKRAAKSKTKKRLLTFVLMGRVVHRNIISFAESGDLASAIGALSAAAMASGELAALYSETESKSVPGKKTAAKRRAYYDKQSEEALARWRSELSPDLSATAAAEKLRAMGVSLSLDKLMRIISAEKRGMASDRDAKLPADAKVRPLKSVR